MDKERIIHEFVKNTAEVVRITESEFNNEILFHIRIYVRSRDFDTSDEVWLPTKKGIAFKRDDLPDLFRAIEALKKYAGGLNS